MGAGAHFDGECTTASGLVQSSAGNRVTAAAKILDLEESGAFRFWDADELEQLVREAGFEPRRSEPSLGSPPQAVVVAALRP